MRRKRHKVAIAGNQWALDANADLPSDRWGDCSDPSTTKRRIRVSRRARGEFFVQVLIHELIHARWWAICESEVTEFAAEVTAILRLFPEEVLEAMGIED